MTEVATFEPFAKEAAYVHVNERLVARIFNRLNGSTSVDLLDVGAGTGLMTNLANARAEANGIELRATLLDPDPLQLHQAQIEVVARQASYILGSAGDLPFVGTYDAAIFANALHLLDDELKASALSEIHRVLRPGGVFAFNSTFYDGAYPEESKPFYSRWIRRAIVEINRRLPDRVKSEKVQAMEWLAPDQYRDLVTEAGFKIIEMRERRVQLSQAAVRAISSYRDFAKGALHATDEDVEEAAKALQVTVQQTFRDLKMKYLPRNWLEIVAIKP